MYFAGRINARNSWPFNENFSLNTIENELLIKPSKDALKTGIWNVPCSLYQKHNVHFLVKVQLAKQFDQY